MIVSQMVDNNNMITVSKNSMAPVAKKFYLVHPESFASYVDTQEYHNAGLLKATPCDINGYWRLLHIMRRSY